MPSACPDPLPFWRKALAAKSADYVTNFTAHAASSAGACFFAIFAVIAIQGVLLNLLPPRWFARVTVYVQGVLAAVLFLTGLFSFSISGWSETTARWAPQVWFLGLHEYLLGDSQFSGLAARAVGGLSVAIGTTVVGYLISYRRYRRLLLKHPQRIDYAARMKMSWADCWRGPRRRR